MPNDGRNSPPAQPQADNQGYEGDQSNIESVENSPRVTPAPGTAGLQVEPESSQTASLHVEPESNPATCGVPVESESDQATADGDSNAARAAARWYRQESSSEPEWPMAPPMALDLSDWSDSFTQSDSHSLNSNSSWETVEMEVVIGETPEDLPPNEPQVQSEGENWDSELAESGATETIVTGTLHLAMSSGPLRNNDAYDAHIRLDQNGTTSDDSQPWETANDDESAPDEPLPTHN